MIQWITILITILLTIPAVVSLTLGGYELTVETDKSQYYPGEDVLIFGWLTENGTGVPMSGVCLNVTDPEETSLFGGCMITNETGYYDVLITLQPDAVFGIYDVESHSIEFDIYAYTTFEVILDNDPPEAPTIDGPTTGNIGEEYDYTFITTDPDGDNVSYWVVWGDGCPAVEWIGPYPSEEEITLSHTFEQQGTFNISAKAKDTHEAESEWGFLDIEMPVKTPTFGNILYQILERLLEQFPIIEQIFSNF